MMRKSPFSMTMLSVGALFVSAGLPSLVVAQEDPVLEEVVVTGSIIRRERDFETPSPIQTLDLKEIGAAGAGQVQDLFRTLSVNAGSEVATSQNSRQGVSQFSLRGLGLSGTLTLVNGRRAGLSPIASGDGAFFTDVNQYPVNMIERVEVLTDGASATYGSEAVGGVVNVITRDNFEGAEFGVEFRDSNNSSYQFNAAFGSNFEKGRFATFMNYYRQSGVFRGEFDWLQERSNGGNQLATASFWDSSTGAGRYNLAVDPDGDGIYARSGGTVADAHCGSPNAVGVVNTFVSGDNCRYVFIDQRRLVPEEQRFQSFTSFSYDLSDTVSLFSEFSFSSNKIHDAIGGAVLRTQTDHGGFFVPAEHPFNYFVDDGSGNVVWDEAAVTAGTGDPSAAVDVIFRGRPLTTFDGELADDIVRKYDNTRTVLGVDVDISDAWSLNASYMFARTQFSDRQPRSYHSDAFRDAIASTEIREGVEVDVYAWNPFGIAWAQPNAMSVKDGTSVSGNTAAGLDLISANRVFQAEAVQQVIEAVLSGELMETSAGDVLAALGLQYRNLDYDDIADSLSEFQLDGRADPVFSINDAKQDVYSIFAEASIPATQNLNLQVALRYEDYGDSEGGSTFDPKLGAQWHMTDTWMLRGSYGTSFQAPSIRNTAGAVGSGSLIDNANGVVTPGNECGTDDDDFNAAHITTGNDSLKPQSAANYNLGVVFQNSKFTGSVDYWAYTYEDLIQASEDVQSIVDGECQVTDASPSTKVYMPDPRVIRDAVGQLNSVTTDFINVGQVDTSGMDFNASYSFEDVFGGMLTISGVATVIFDFDIDDDGTGTAIFDAAGNRNGFIGFGSIPDTRINLSFNWANDRHLAGLTGRYIGAYDDRVPTDSETREIDSQLVWDVQYGIDLDIFGEGSTNVTAGINNLLDEEPPDISRNPDRRIGHDGQVHSPLGRTIYVRAKYNF